MKITKSNKELLIRVQKNDKVAFYNLYTRYCKRLYGFALQYLKTNSDAEKVVQQVFIKIWEKRHSIDINSPFELYLFNITYYGVARQLQKKYPKKTFAQLEIKSSV